MLFHDHGIEDHGEQERGFQRPLAEIADVPFPLPPNWNSALYGWVFIGASPVCLPPIRAFELTMKCSMFPPTRRTVETTVTTVPAKMPCHFTMSAEVFLKPPRVWLRSAGVNLFGKEGEGVTGNGLSVGVVPAKAA